MTGPDRTTSSFLAASTLNLPLSSKGPNHAPSLERGKACLTCRSRKVKCDGVKPVCGACTKSALAHGDDPALLACNFNEDEARGEKRKRGPGQGTGKVAALEAKIAELERFIAQGGVAAAGDSQVASTGNDSYGTAETLSSFATTPFMNTFDTGSTSADNAANRNNFDVLLQASGQQSSTSWSASSQYFIDAAEPSTFFQPFFDNSAPRGPTTPPDVLLDLFYPGWPRDLPSPSLVGRLVKVFFTKSHCTSGMINQRKFELALTLPPTHSGFPHVALLHAILATSSRMVSEDFFAQEERYWAKTDPAETVADYHGARAQAAIDAAISKGERLFQVNQAVVLLCFYAYTNARFVMVWLTCGLATRMATPLGLNHLRPLQTDTRERPLHLKPAMLPPPADEEELYERSATFWFTVVCDRFASASTGWPMGLNDDDISSLLPSPIPAPDQDLISSPLCHHNSNFMTHHPPHLVQPIQLFLKSIILLGRVHTLMQRSPPPMGMAINKDSYFSNDMHVDIRTTAPFKRLDQEIINFRLSIPREYQNTHQNATSDTRLCIVYAVPHACTILLHEPLCTMIDGDVSFTRCMVSARAILESIYSLWSTSFDVGYLAPFINYCWAVAGRTLVRDLAIKQAKGVTAGVEEARSDVNVILNAMRAYKSPLGDSVARSLQHLLEDPAQCLPNQHFEYLDFAADGVVGGMNTVGCPILPGKFTSIGPLLGGRPSSASGSSPGGTFSSTSAPSPVDFAAMFDPLLATHSSGIMQPPIDPERFKDLMNWTA